MGGIAAHARGGKRHVRIAHELPAQVVVTRREVTGNGATGGAANGNTLRCERPARAAARGTGGAQPRVRVPDPRPGSARRWQRRRTPASCRTSGTSQGHGTIQRYSGASSTPRTRALAASAIAAPTDACGSRSCRSKRASTKFRTTDGKFCTSATDAVEHHVRVHPPRTTAAACVSRIDD